MAGNTKARKLSGEDPVARKRGFLWYCGNLVAKTGEAASQKTPALA